MPELPEVETVRRGLSELLPGLTVKSVKSDWAKSFPNAKNDTEKFLIGAKIVQVRRRGKVLIIDLSTEYSLIIHLKMTGQLVFRSESAVFGAGHPTKSLLGELPDKSTRVILDLDGAKLFFNDQRKFGWVRLVPTLEIDNIDFFKKLGPEPLGDDFNAKNFRERLRKRPNSRIKPALLDQTVIAGVGNIYADEALWGAMIHPEKRVREITDKNLSELYKELLFVLRLAIEKGGSTDKNYVDAEGKKGSYLQFARVFRRENLPCPRCGTTIEKIRVGGRGTHLCPRCQKSPAV
ncbi:MAG TPA: bifunctional DNA-formamidopyrimidine glycosylase/DNA-(apurinic or apyrimidinic site) lyase [Candidatus Saccharimonadales bacterium]|nr:bifunctional DNA-formamidopyrimidine glycosylase/DNA-(apurinic or apyrimidinic site) lyase [Candidatus Saccharimonadales bacterium]